MLNCRFLGILLHDTRSTLRLTRETLSVGSDYAFVGDRRLDQVILEGFRHHRS